MSEEKTLKEMMLVHFEDDKKSFANIKELQTINGDHMSHFRTDLTKVMTMLEQQNVSAEKHREIIKQHMDRVEPMISSYETNVIVAKENGKTLKKWGGYAIGFASTIGAWYIIKGFVIKLFIK